MYKWNLIRIFESVNKTKVNGSLNVESSLKENILNEIFDDFTQKEKNPNIKPYKQIPDPNNPKKRIIINPMRDPDEWQDINNSYEHVDLDDKVNQILNGSYSPKRSELKDLSIKLNDWDIIDRNKGVELLIRLLEYNPRYIEYFDNSLFQDPLFISSVSNKSEKGKQTILNYLSGNPVKYLTPESQIYLIEFSPYFIERIPDQDLIDLINYSNVEDFNMMVNACKKSRETFNSNGTTETPLSKLYRLALKTKKNASLRKIGNK